MRVKTTSVLALILFMAMSSVRSQEIQVCQPDSAKIYYNTNNGWQFYGGVWDFRCSYDEDGLLTQMRTDVFQGESCVVREYQYEYDPTHNVVRTDYVGYDCEAPGGVTYKEESVYEDCLLVSQAKYTLQPHAIGKDGPWICNDSTVFKYDPERRLILKESFDSNLTHVATVHYEYSDHQTVETSERLENGVWTTTQRVTKSLSDNNTLLSVLTETNSDGALVNVSFVSYGYDGQDLCVSVLTQKWEDDTWVNVKQLLNTYEDGKLTLAELKTWQNEAFDNSNRAVYDLNSDGYPVEIAFENWNGSDWEEGGWVPDFNIFSDSHLNRQNRELGKEMVKRLVIHYADTPLPDYNLDEHQNNKGFCSVYPNPTNGLFIVIGKELKSAEVYNTLGQHIATTQGEGNQLMVDLSDQQTGIYFVNVTDKEGRKCVRKVVKQ